MFIKVSIKKYWIQKTWRSCGRKINIRRKTLNKIFDLSKDGISFKVKCERQGEFPTYVSSKFGPAASKIAGLDSDGQNEVYEMIHDLESVFPVKSYDELKLVLNEHYHGKVEEDAVEEEEDDVPFDDPPAKAAAPKKEEKSDDPLDDDKVKELLEGLNS